MDVIKDILENEELYLKEYFSIESEVDYMNDLLSIYTLENASLAYQNVELLFSTENLRDKISFHKSRLLILFKQCISELIRIVIEFFTVGTTQKKVMLMIYKQISAAMKSLDKTFQNRITRDGYYKFEDHPVEIRSTESTLCMPTILLSLIGSVLNLNLEQILRKNRETLFIKYSKIPLGVFSTANTSNRMSSSTKIFDALVKLGGVHAKVAVILQMFSKGFIPTFTDKVLNRVIVKGNGGQGTDPATLTVSYDKFKDLIKENNPSELAVYYRGLADCLGIDDITNTEYDFNTFTLWDIHAGLIEDRFMKVFKIDRIGSMKSTADEILEGVEDAINDILKEGEEIIIDSSDMYKGFCKTLPEYSKALASLFKTLDYKKEMEKIRKDLDDVNKKINSLDGDLFEELDGEINLMKYITAVTYQYNVSKTILYKYIKIAIKYIDNGITDLKKVEASLA